MRVVAAICLLVNVAWAQWGKPAQVQHLKTFTSPDGTFQFNYPYELIVCRNQQGWAPVKNCAAYHPVCDGDTPESYTGIVCLAYPRNQFTDTDAFEAATFSVEILDEASVKSCLAKPADDTFVKRTPITIHGIKFVNFEFGEGGMNQAVSGNVYRTFHGGRCYQLGINAATASAQVFDPPAREMTQRDWDAVNGSFKEARNSFRFLK